MKNGIKKVTSRTFLKMKEAGEKISMLAAYDYASAKYADEAGIDGILTGDSLGMTMLGYDSTVQVTMDDMAVFTGAVSRGAERAMVIADMPFLSFQISKEDTLKNAGRLVRAGAEAVKIEGCSDFILEQISALTQAGISVMGHLGFTPQYINTIGGYFIQGKSYENAEKMLNAAKRLEQAGVFAIVLEMAPEETADYICRNINVPLIGIGAGKFCSGQILVIDDILGRYSGNIPKFAKKYANIKDIIKDAAAKYNKEVKEGIFPAEEHAFRLSEEERVKFDSRINK